MSEKQPLILLGQPLGGRMADSGAIIAATLHATGGKLQVAYSRKGCSSLPQTFNQCWADAIANPGKFDYFAMLHSDVEPQQGWLDVLYDEIVRTKATVVSAVCAIKDGKGVTSTGVGPVDDDYEYRRLTVTECQKLPQTFGLADVKAANLWPDEYWQGGLRCLLVNTGCWIADLSWPKWYEVRPDGCFDFVYEQKHRIQKWPDGSVHCEFAPEDWLLSRYVCRHGGTALATRLFRVAHWGEQMYPNWQTWGAETDVEIDRYRADREAAYRAAQTAAA